MNSLAYLLRYFQTPAGRKIATLAITVALALAGVTAAVVLVIPSPDGGPPLTTVTVGGPHATPDKELAVPKEALADAQASEIGDHQGLASENPPGLSDAAKEDARIQAEALAANDQLPIITPDAAPSQRGCTTKLVQNYSSRRGVRPRVFVLHYTVSANRPGLSDVNAIVGLFDRPSFAASSNYVIDNEGNCAYIVRESDKAWTQAAANSFSISVEVINTGHESSYAAVAGLRKIALVASDSLKRWEIPVQQGLVVGCVIKRSGIIDHNSLGACGGGHHDITPYSVPAVVAAVRSVRTVVAPKPLLPVYLVVAWKPGAPAVKQRTRHPSAKVKAFVALGYTRLSAVKVKQ